MKAKNIITMGALLIGTYWTGKIVGAHEGAKAALDKYGDLIPDEEITVKLIDKAKYVMSVTAKKAKGS